MEESKAFAALGSRGLALFLDLTFLFLLLFALEAAEIEPGTAGALAVVLAYFVFLPVSPLRGTPGKRLAGVRVTDLSGRPIGLGRSALRFAVSVLSVGAAGIGLAVAAWTPKRQSLHDLAAATLVLKSGAGGEVEGSRALRMSWPARLGFTALVGALALAIYSTAQYQQAVARREAIREMLEPVSELREEVQRALAEGRPMPAARLPRHARAFHVRPDGTIVVEGGAGPLEDVQFLFRPTIDSAGRASWKCSVRNLEPRQAPTACRD